MLNTLYEAELYNYTTGQSFTAHFPINEKHIKQIMSQGEVMVDNCHNLDLPELGLSLTEMNDIITLINEHDVTPEELTILNQTYLLSEITEKQEKDIEIHIIDFDEETATWASNNFCSEYDKGLLLYELGFTFPAEVPEALKDYMNYEMLWRDCSINNSIREVTYNGRHFLIWHD